MSKECLNRQEVSNKLDSGAVSVNSKELATKEYCLSMGADSKPLEKYGTYECPPDDDIIISRGVLCYISIADPDGVSREFSNFGTLDNLR